MTNWKMKIKDNKWIETLPSNLQNKVKALQRGCGCDREKRINKLIPEMLKFYQ